MGLGLWVSKKIVELHGGQLTVFTADDEGHADYRVRVTLPLQKKGTNNMSGKKGGDSSKGTTDDSSFSRFISLMDRRKRYAKISLAKESEDRRPLREESSEDILLEVQKAAEKSQSSHRLHVPPSIAGSPHVQDEINSTVGEGLVDIENCGMEEPGCNLTFLVVDDSALNRKFIVRTVRTLFSGQGALLTFLEASDGVPAVQKMKEILRADRGDDGAEGTHVLLLDNIMTEMNGPEVAREVRAMGFTGPIVAITGNVLYEDVRNFLASGADRVVPKPIDSTSLKLIFRQLLPEYEHCLI